MRRLQHYVLLVDDSVAIRRSVRKLFEEAGWKSVAKLQMDMRQLRKQSTLSLKLSYWI